MKKRYWIGGGIVAAGLAGSIVVGHLQEYRVQGGEPADGAGQVGVGEQLLPAVGPQVHEQASAAAPAGVGQGQGGQQHVVDLGVVDGGHLL